MRPPRCLGDCQGVSECAHEDLCLGARGARVCGSWPYTGTPTMPGPLTEDELDAHNAERYPSPAPRIPRRPQLPLAVTPAMRDAHPAEAVSGPHKHGLGLWDRLVWRWRAWRADRLWPRGVQR